ncbi:MAG: PKD domain-containing protein, partial [Schleiferiaceae bacterium]|nr:PKD domain-containing protein [Schleiferiaceae bacterium]
NTFGNNTGFFTQFATTALEFTVNSWLTIDSVTIYPENSGLINIALRTNPGDSLIANRTIEVPSTFTGGAFRVALGISLLPGNYRLAVDPSGTTVSGLGRTSTNTQYPYALNNDIIITGNSSNEPAIYYFFYNWRVTVGDICPRPDSELTVILGTPPSAAFTDDVATGTPGLTGFTVNVDASGSQGGTQFHWDFGDGNTGTGMMTSHTFTANGAYTITLVVTNPCGSDTLTRTITIQGIHVEWNDLVQEINMFPNPTSGTVTISFDMLASRDVQLQIINSLGEVIVFENWKQLAGSQTMQYDISHLSAGAYSVRLSVGEAIVVRKLVKI